MLVCKKLYCIKDDCENYYFNDDYMDLSAFCPKIWNLVSQKAKAVLRGAFLLPHLDEYHLDIIQHIKNERSYLNTIEEVEGIVTAKGMQDFYSVLDNVADAALYGVDYKTVG